MTTLFPAFQFDANEWFVVAASVIIWAAFLAAPNRLMMPAWIGLCIFNVFLGRVTDITIATVPLDLYDVNDSEKYEWFDVLMYAFTYAPAGMLVVKLFLIIRPRGPAFLGYLAACAAVTVALEYAAWLAGVFHYKGWRLVYSFPVYMLSYALNIAVCRYIIRYTGEPEPPPAPER